MNNLFNSVGTKLSGTRVKENFGYLECLDGKPDFSIIRNIVMNGHHDGRVLYVIRNYVDPELCKSVSDSFDREIVKNGGNRKDDDYVLTNQIGATQFARNGKQYIQEVLKVGQATIDLLDQVSDKDVENLFLTKYLEDRFLDSKIHFGASRYKNGWSAFATFRRWLDNGLMSLMPHEDKAQLACAEEDEFEIHLAQTITSFNVCLEGSADGGDLMIWNFAPDAECRDSFGVTKTGYPYHPDTLQGVDSLAVRLNQGDVYFMNACKLHGVKSVTAGKRLTAGRFIGKLSDNKVVFWT